MLNETWADFNLLPEKKKINKFFFFVKKNVGISSSNEIGTVHCRKRKNKALASKKKKSRVFFARG